ncbi:77 kDa echinoderm microtubule-associated protein-like isoform X1 [Diadema antillarum]|uniref:77 kDa echinoderm microtubule-associated protein-like isoform X1 n=1 Tax=Diadema antillarum TaxID=105358 RepID=UPI003A8BDFE1
MIPLSPTAAASPPGIAMTTSSHAVNNAMKLLEDTAELFEVDSVEDDVHPAFARRSKSTNSHPIPYKMQHSLPAHIWNKYSSGLDEFLIPNEDYSLELSDRVAALERTVRDQQDEITCLKTALADVVRRLAAVEHSAKNNTRGIPQGPFKVRDVPGLFNSSPLPSRPPVPSGDRHRMKRPSTPEPKRRTASFGNSEKDRLKRWGSTESDGFFPDSGSSRRSASLTNLSGSRRERRVSSGSSSGGFQKEPQYNAASHASYNSEEGYIRIYLRGRPVTSYLPSDVEEYDLNAKHPAPTEKLKLDWVYGYRGRDSRCNLYLLPTGEIVYFMAAVVVLYNVEEQQQRHYLGHNDDVKCIAVHPDSVTIATGQVAGHDPDEGKPHVRIWNSVTLETMHVLGLGFFDRAVCSLSFSKLNVGLHLAAVDESNEHVLSLWDWKKEKKLSDVKSSQDPVLACEFHPNIEEQVITLGKGHIHFWNFSTGKLVKKSGIFEKYDKPKFMLSLAFAPNGDAITGDSNGNIYIWGKGNTRISQAILGAHEGGIFSLCVFNDGSFLSGGGKDRKIVLWDSDYKSQSTTQIPETTGPVRTLCKGKGEGFFVGTTRNALLTGDMEGEFQTLVQAHTEELWGLALHPSQALFLTCAYDKNVFLWDFEQHKPIWSKTMEESCQSAGFHPSGNVVAIGMTSGRWVALDVQSQELITVHTDGKEQHDIIRYSPDGNYLAVASHDNFIYIYSVSEEGRKYSKLGKCSGHSSFVTHIDWSSDSTKLQSNSGDYELLFWDATTCKQIVNSKETRDIEWATFTCVLGYPVCGIWPEGSDGTDVNTVARSTTSTLLATGDDFGKVNLFRYPVNHPKAACSSFKGHSSHVTSVIFNEDSTKLISTGGRDMSCMQWTVV